MPGRPCGVGCESSQLAPSSLVVKMDFESSTGWMCLLGNTTSEKKGSAKIVGGEQEVKGG